MISPRVTGSIVTHNNMKAIKETLDTIFANIGNVDFRLYVIDNASTDGTPNFIREQYPQVCLIEPMTNNGFGAGHNLVLPMIESDYHIIINPDIIIKDNAIEKMINFLDAQNDIGVLSPKNLLSRRQRANSRQKKSEAQIPFCEPLEERAGSRQAFA